MTLTPLHDILNDLQESIKHTVRAHRAEASGTWLNLCPRLDSTTTLSVYCDCSVIAGRFYLGVCIAGLHTCKLLGSIVNTNFPEHTVLGEIQALEFAIQCLRHSINPSEYDSIKSITVFTDVDHIQRLLSCNTQRMRLPVSTAIRRLNQHISEFSEVYPSIRLRINFLGNPAQRKNIYYKAAHKVARAVARVNSRTTW